MRFGAERSLTNRNQRGANSSQVKCRRAPGGEGADSPEVALDRQKNRAATPPNQKTRTLAELLTGGVLSGHPPDSRPVLAPSAFAEGTGAAFAKERLDEAEREAAHRHREAVSSGNPALIRSSLAAWAKLLAEVREFHKAVTAAERVGGDKVPLAEAVQAVGRLVHGLAVTMRQSLQPLAHVLAQAPAETGADAVAAGCNAYLATLGGVVTAESGTWVAGIPPLPEWVRRGVAEGLAWPYGAAAATAMTEAARKVVELAAAQAASEAKGES